MDQMFVEVAQWHRVCKPKHLMFHLLPPTLLPARLQLAPRMFVSSTEATVTSANSDMRW